MDTPRPARIFPWRYGLFLLLLTLAVPLARHLPWHAAAMAGFDGAATVFLLACLSMLRMEAGTMRRAAVANDANRGLMLLLTGIVAIVILIAVGVAVTQHGAAAPSRIALVLGTLAIAWLFTNTIYALHYAHIFYLADQAGRDRGGLDFPERDEPDYWDFLYFAFTLGMTFQTSDVQITDPRIRKVALFHSLAAFLFNLGIVAFTINILGG